VTSRFSTLRSNIKIPPILPAGKALSADRKTNINRGSGPQHIHNADETAGISITGKEIVVQFQKRTDNPLLIAAGFDKATIPIPRLNQKKRNSMAF
jgi:hypothetical protein